MNKILYISNFLSQHGINPILAETIIIKLRNLGWDVKISSNKLDRFIRMVDMIISTITSKFQNRIIVLDLFSGKNAIIFAEVISFLTRLIGSKLIIVLRGGNLPFLLKIDRKRVSRLVNRANIIISPSQYLASYFNFVKKIKIIPNSIEIKKYKYNNRINNKPKILFLRSFHKLTRPQDAIMAVNLLAEEYPEITLGMAGWDEDGTLAECIALVEKLGLKERVKFLGKLEKKEIYSLSDDYDLFIHTMMVDNTPVSVIEAMALGLNIVATNVGGLPYLIDDNKTGLLVDPKDVKAMAAAIKYYLENSDQALFMRENARKVVIKMNLDTVIKQWEDILNDL